MGFARGQYAVDQRGVFRPERIDDHQVAQSPAILHVLAQQILQAGPARGRAQQGIPKCQPVIPNQVKGVR
jgi:hypothetical protein